MTTNETKRKGKQSKFTYVGGAYPGICYLVVNGVKVYYAKYRTADKVEHKEKIGPESEGWTLSKVRDERAIRKRGKAPTNRQQRDDAAAKVKEEARAVAENTINDSTTLAEYAEAWLERKRKVLRFSTVEDYASALRAHIIPALGKVPIRQITFRMLDDFVGGIDGISGRRINRIMGPVKGIFADALKRKDIDENPAEDVDRRKETRPQIDPLSFDEMKAFLAHVDPYYFAYFSTAFMTGARPSELFALKWSNVDFKTRTITIREGRVRGQEGPPKTESSNRDIDINDDLLEILRQDRMTSPADAVYVFVGKRLGQPLEVGNLRADIWYPTLERAGLRRRTMYQTRHTFASLSIMAGEDLLWIQRTLGHETLGMIFRHYGKWIKGRNRQREDGRKFLAGLHEVTPATKAIADAADVAVDVVDSNEVAS